MGRPLLVTINELRVREISSMTFKQRALNSEADIDGSMAGVYMTTFYGHEGTPNRRRAAQA